MEECTQDERPFFGFFVLFSCSIFPRSRSLFFFKYDHFCSPNRGLAKYRRHGVMSFVDIWHFGNFRSGMQDQTVWKTFSFSTQPLASPPHSTSFRHQGGVTASICVSVVTRCALLPTILLLSCGSFSLSLASSSSFSFTSLVTSLPLVSSR